MRIDYDAPPKGAWIAESQADFEGWEVLKIVDYKPGVKQVYVRRVDASGRGEFRIVYSREEFSKGIVINA